MSRKHVCEISLALAGLALLAMGGGFLLNGGIIFLWPFCMIPLALFSLGIAFLLTPLILPSRSHALKIIGYFCLFALMATAAFTSFGIRRHRLAQFQTFANATLAVSPGLNKNQVIELLGQPARKSKTNDRHRENQDYMECWTYNGKAALQYADIYFNAEGKVIERFYDH